MGLSCVLLVITVECEVVKNVQTKAGGDGWGVGISIRVGGHLKHPS